MFKVLNPRVGAAIALLLSLGLLFATPALAAEAPTILSAKSSGETRTTADLEAQVNPGGEAASYAFEYGPSEANGLTVTGSIPAGSVEVSVPVELTGLKEGIEYHWRLSVENTAGSVTSKDHTFVYTLGGGGLPDGRQYEMVTPPEKNGAQVGTAFAAAFGSQVADKEEGTGKEPRVLSFSLQCFAGSPACLPVGEGLEGIPFEFTRGLSGWVTHPLAPSTESFAPSSPAAVNVDADAELFKIRPVESNGTYGEPEWLGEKEGSFIGIGPVGESQAEIFSATAANEVATANFSHLVYQTEGRAWSFDPTLPNANADTVYEYEGSGSSHPHMVAIAPNSTELVSRCGSEIGGVNPSKYNALSEDGETVYFTARPCGEGSNGGQPPVSAYTLYARYEHSRSELISGPAPVTAPVDGEGCDSSCQAQPPSFGNFEGASADGSSVFFTDPHQLTDGASEDTSEISSENRGPYCHQEQAAGASGCNLYESECPDRCANPSERRLVDVSAGDKPAGGPRVLATVAISTDGSHVYFVARGVLTGANREGDAPADGEPNLYVYERDASVPGGRLSFVATLASGSETDEDNWNTGATSGVGDANVTPDGRFLVFMSKAALTPDDTRVEAEPPNQVYRYDAETGTLQRVSIGAKGFRDDGNESAVGKFFNNTEILEAYLGIERFLDPLRPDPTMSDDGSFVFFQSPIGLTPHALNDVVVGGTPENPKYAQNVYEWEAPDTEINNQTSCSEPSGCLSLISDGKDVGENNNKVTIGKNSSELIGTDGSGANVIIATSDELVPQDTDTERDFYDAHICSTGEPCPPPPAEASPPCLGEVCHGIPAAQQPAPTGGTLTLNGLGNIGPAAHAVKAKALTRAQKLAGALKVCHKDRRRAKRTRCEKAARGKFGPLKRAKKR